MHNINLKSYLHNLDIPTLKDHHRNRLNSKLSCKLPLFFHFSYLTQAKSLLLYTDFTIYLGHPVIYAKKHSILR